MRRTPLISAVILLGILASGCASLDAAGSQNKVATATASGSSSAYPSPSAVTTYQQVTEPTPDPTPEQKTLTFTGRGAKVVKLKGADRDAAWLASFTHRGSSNFIVNPIDPEGAEQGAIVNHIGSYKGTTMFNVENGSEAGGLKIQADGAWTLKLKPLEMARLWEGSKVSGRGDDVIAFSPQPEGLTTLEAKHSGSSNFIVYAYSENSTDNLVNEIGSWKGEVLLPDGTVFMSIEADGSWSFTKS